MVTERRSIVLIVEFSPTPDISVVYLSYIVLLVAIVPAIVEFFVPLLESLRTVPVRSSDVDEL